MNRSLTLPLFAVLLVSLTSSVHSTPTESRPPIVTSSIDTLAARSHTPAASRSEQRAPIVSAGTWDLNAPILQVVPSDQTVIKTGLTEDIKAYLPAGEEERLKDVIAQDKKEKEEAAAKKKAEEEAAKVEEKKKKQAEKTSAGGVASEGKVVPANEAQRIAKKMVTAQGWGNAEFGCLVKLWNKESGWNYRAANPSSGAYGIPQSLPGSKMASAGKDWKTNPTTQIKWGLGYIKGRYKTPCNAWAHSVSVGWY